MGNHGGRGNYQGRGGRQPQEETKEAGGWGFKTNRE